MRASGDHFSDAADDYSRHRPRYPAELFDYLAGEAPGRALAWDCATGSGQAAEPLAERFERVIGTDVSLAQLRRRPRRARARYVGALAEAAPLADGSVDLVTVSQALHWFDFERFFSEARRVLVPAGLVAAWSYDLLRVDAAVDALVDHVYTEVVGPYWLPERRHVVSGYATIPFPFEPLTPPPFRMSARWSRDRLVGYVATWSATGRYRKARGEDPVPAFERRLEDVWPRREEVREVTWNLTVLAGRADRKEGRREP